MKRGRRRVGNAAGAAGKALSRVCNSGADDPDSIVVRDVGVHDLERSVRDENDHGRRDDPGTSSWSTQLNVKGRNSYYGSGTVVRFANVHVFRAG